MSFLAPGFLWLLGLSLPLIALYFFRQRQEDRVVPTNFLWVQAIQDTRTAAVWRKFLKSILLALQLLFLALLVLALSGATASLWDSGSNRLVVTLLDRSASMAVHDGDADGATRFEAALAALDNAIDGLQDGDRMMIIAVDDRAEIIEPYTGEKERLRLAASKLSVRELPTRLDEAVILLRSQITAAAGRDIEVLLLSDGAFDDPGGLEGARISFVPFGTKSENAGITDVRVIRGPGASPSLFVSIEVFGDKPLDRTVSLWSDGRLVDARQAKSDPGGQAVAFFPLEGVETGPLELRLEGEDDFATDDRAWCVFRPEPPRTIAIYGKGNRFLERIPTLRPGLEGPVASVADEADLRKQGVFDCLVFDGHVPDNPPPSRTAIYVNCVPPGGEITRGAEMSYPPVLDWSRTHPITRHADFSDLVVVEGFRLEGVPPTGVLVDSPEGPLIALVSTPNQEALYIPFDLAKSNFPLRLAFPLVMANALDWFFSERRAGDEEEILRTGHPLVRRIPEGGRLKVTPPGGDSTSLVAGPSRRAVYRATWNAGVYPLETPSGPGVAAASLLNRRETEIAPKDVIETGGVQHEATPEAVRANLLLRDPLIYLALLILTFEWVLWIRRS